MEPVVANSPAMVVHSWLGLTTRLRARSSHAGSFRGGLRGAVLDAAGFAAAGPRGGVGPRGGRFGPRGCCGGMRMSVLARGGCHKIHARCMTPRRRVRHVTRHVAP